METERIMDQLARAHDGDPWHGSSARTVLAGVGAAQPSTRSMPRSRS